MSAAPAYVELRHGRGVVVASLYEADGVEVCEAQEGGTVAEALHALARSLEDRPGSDAYALPPCDAPAGWEADADDPTPRCVECGEPRVNH